MARVKEEKVAETTTHNAIGYIRVSTEQQAGEDKFGVDAQKKAIEEYANKNGYTITSWKVDEASGASDDRPALNDILYGEIQNPPVEAVIVFKNDRVARDTKLYFYYLYVLEKKNIKLLSTREEFAEGDEFTNIYRALLQFVAEQERKNIALRTGKGRSIKAQCGGYSGGRAPIGYSVQSGRLVVNEHEAEIVRFIFKLHREGKNLLEIEDALIKAGYTNRVGRNFQPAGIRSIILNEKTYRGFYKYGAMNEWVKGVHEPILDD